MRLLSVLLAIVALYHFVSLPVRAADLQLSLNVGDTSFTISGTTSPLAHITILENTAVVGTMDADVSGTFTQTLHFQEPIIHEYSLYAVNAQNNQTPTYVYHISLTAGVNTTLSGVNLVFPSPTPTPTATPVPASSQLPNTIVSPSPVPLPLVAELLTPLPAPLQVFLVTLGLPTPHLTIANLAEVVRAWVDNWRQVTIASGFGTSGKSPTPAELAKCDINNNNVCDITDLSIIFFYVNK